MMRFGQKFKTWREQKHVSNYLIEQRTGVKRSNLTNLEKGIYRPSDEVLQKLASIPELGISFNQLKVWKAMDDYGPDILIQAAKEIEASLQPET